MAAFIALSWPGFIIAVAILLSLILLGLDGGILKAILEWRPLVVLSRLTYTVYLVHYGILMVLFGNNSQPDDFNVPRFIFTFLGTVTSSFVLALMLNLLVSVRAEVA